MNTLSGSVWYNFNINCNQWRIQDFPQSANSRGGYVSKILYVETKESGPLGGRALAAPPGSAYGNVPERTFLEVRAVLTAMCYN